MTHNQYLNYTGLQILVQKLKSVFVADASLNAAFADSSLKLTLGASYLDPSTADKTSSIFFKGDNGIELSYAADTSVATIKAKDATTDASGVVKLASSFSLPFDEKDLAPGVVDTNVLYDYLVNHFVSSKGYLRVFRGTSDTVDDSSANYWLSVYATNDKRDIADASKNDKVATDYAVKEYVADQISTLESALELKGSIESSKDAVDKLTTAAASKGDVYVVSLSSGTITYNEKTLENGDLVIVKEDSTAGDASEIIVVERNLDGAVTAASALTEDRVVLGAGAQGVKTSDLALGTDDDNDVTKNTLATEKFVEKLANAAGGSLAGHKSATNVVTIDLTSKETGAAQGNLGSVVVKGADSGYISVDFAEGEGIKLSANTVAISTATTGNDGLASALDVSTSIKGAIEALDVDAFAEAAVDGSVLTVYGLKEVNGKISIDEDNKKTFTDTRVASGVSITKIGTISDASLNVQEALDYVYKQATSSGVTEFGGKTGAITVDTAATEDGSVKFAMSDNKLTATVVYVDSSMAPVVESSGTYTFYNVKRGTNGKLAQDGSISELSPILAASIDDLFK